MKVLERLKLELNNREYFKDEEYTQFLKENTLDPNLEYDKKTMQRDLLLTCIDILEALANDTDLMRKLDNNDIMSTTEAYKYLTTQIDRIKQKIATIPIANDEYTNSCFNLMFTKSR